MDTIEVVRDARGNLVRVVVHAERVEAKLEAIVVGSRAYPVERATTTVGLQGTTMIEYKIRLGA